MIDTLRDTRPVRASEQLDWSRLTAYLRAELPKHIDGFDARAEMEVEQFPGGHSNLTYLLRFGDRELVLRRPPFGPVPPRAHDMARECRVLAAVHPVFPLAPQPYLLCDDPEIAGFIFYVMERRSGTIIRFDEPPELRDRIDLRRGISEAIVDTLADLHTIDVAAHGLDTLGKPAGFVARQIRGWTERWHGSKTSDIPEMEQLAVWLEKHTPADPQRPALVHGDYKLDNVMLDASKLDRLVAVFDWEMSAIGDPLVDLGILLCYWVHIAAESRDDAIGTVTARPGWFTRDEILQRYADRAKRSVDGIAIFEVFAVFKLAVVLQQIYARYVRGQTDDPRFAALGDRVTMLARKAALLAEELS
ncbi:MAG TPA: phosphotransferase family protein [Thermoanaerobaculia bacterium]|jgi:aminoglycoside phosphotransferase (APT) family kinase protein